MASDIQAVVMLGIAYIGFEQYKKAPHKKT